MQKEDRRTHMPVEILAIYVALLCAFPPLRAEEFVDEVNSRYVRLKLRPENNHCQINGPPLLTSLLHTY